ncbi:MAG: ubiquinone biosynthesis monooxygenase Coq7 [Lentisphaeria bacterium]|jgi:ubiquinone biosynthesis monooxygenase Coq7
MQTNNSIRDLTVLDNLISGFDRALRSLTPGTQTLSRPTPIPNIEHESSNDLSAGEKHHSAGLMRVNHSGEVCAQALYQGQALTAKLPEVQQEMEVAADEEIDHLAWCEERLRGLDGRPSVLNPMWYAMSFGIGAAAGLVSDKVSLGFIAATEDQVCKHLEEHLQKLPETDEHSKVIIKQMLVDEKKHAHAALNAGGFDFPRPVKSLMSLASKAMTSASYRM